MLKTHYGPYSPSRLDVATCPYRFKAEYIDKTSKDESSLPARRGTVVHETFEQITRGWLADKPLNWDDILALLTKKMAENTVTDREDQALCVGAARAYLGNPPQGIKNTLGTEEHLALMWNGKDLEECAWDSPECFVRGKIDILQIDENDCATIIDHKTQLHIQTADTFQLGFYAWIITKFYPYVKEIRTILHFCHPERNWYSKPYLWSKEELSDIEDQVKMAISVIESTTEFPAQPYHGCQYCTVRSICPKLLKIKEDKKRLKGSPLIDAKSAQEMAGEVTVIEEYRKEAMDALKTFSKEIGPVVVPGIEYSFSESSSYEVGKDHILQLIDLLNKFGVNLPDYIKFDTTKMTKTLWKGLKQEQLEEVKKLLTPVKKTRFGSHRI